MAVKALERKHHDLYEPLCGIVGSKYVADEDFATFAYSRDLDLFPGKIPGIIVRPANTEEVREIVLLANRTRIPIVPMGGRSSLYGFRGGEAKMSIMVDMTRMDKIIDIDEENMIVTAEAGITESKLETEAKRKGFRALTVWCPVYSNTLGGHISGVMGGGGNQDFSGLGFNWLYTMGFKVVLPNGDILQTGGGPGINMNMSKIFYREVSGPDLTGLFIGDGGVLGIKTEVTMRIFPIPKVNKPASYVFDTFEEAWQAEYNAMRISYPHPFNFIMGAPPPMLRLLTGVEMPFHCVFFAIRGDTEEEVDIKSKKIEAACKEAGGRPGNEGTDQIAMGLVVTSEGIREMGGSFSVGNLAAADMYFPMGGFPETFRSFLPILEKYEEGFKKYNIPGLDHFEPCGPNIMMYTIDKAYDGSNPAAKELVFNVTKELYDHCIKRGGIYWDCKGYGTEVMASVMSPAYHSFLRTLKRAIDPNNIMNPGLWRL